MQDIILVGSGGCMREIVWQMQEQNKSTENWNILGYVDKMPPEERMSKESLEELFKNHYEGKRHIGTHEIEEIKVLNIKKIKEQNKIPVYDE